MTDGELVIALTLLGLSKSTTDKFTWKYTLDSLKVLRLLHDSHVYAVLGNGGIQYYEDPDLVSAEVTRRLK